MRPKPTKPKSARQTARQRLDALEAAECDDRVADARERDAAKAGEPPGAKLARRFVKRRGK